MNNKIQIKDTKIVSQVKFSILQNQILKKTKLGNFKELTGSEKPTQFQQAYAVVKYLTETCKKYGYPFKYFSGKIKFFNNVFWEECKIHDLKELLSLISKGLGVNESIAFSAPFREKLLSQFIDSIDRNYEDQPEMLINLLNGSFDFSKMELLDHNHIDNLEYLLPFTYDPEADCPEFQKFLNNVVPDKELQNIIAEYIGYCFIPNSVLKLEKMLILYGKGSNGKSVLGEIIKELIGKENTTSNSLQSLTDNNGYHRASISGKLLNYCTELDNVNSIASFKQLISGEPIDARLPYKEPFTVYKLPKLIFNANALPKKTENTDAFYRRLIIVPFEYQVPKEKRISNLSRLIVEKELPGIFNWVLSGLKRLFANKDFSTSKKAEFILNNYKLESNTVANFLDEVGYIAGEGNKIPLIELFNDYRNWCIDSNYRSVNKMNFKNRLKDLSFSIKRWGDKGDVIHYRIDTK